MPLLAFDMLAGGKVAMSRTRIFGASALAASLLVSCASVPEDSGLASVSDFYERVCDPQKSNLKYKATGHQDTAYLVARFAGWSDSEAAELAYFTEAPDRFWAQYSAPIGSARIFALQFDRWHHLSSVLHSLHGGSAAEVEARRRTLGRLIVAHRDSYLPGSARQAERWKVGFLVHAFGDSFAHVWGVNQGQTGSVSYNPVVGHVVDGVFRGNPDVIAGNPEVYDRYVRALFDVLDRGNGNRGELETYLSEIAFQANAENTGGREGLTDHYVIQRLNSGLSHRSLDNCAAWFEQLDYRQRVRPFLGEVEAAIERDMGR
jgi:hypothetical protein